MKRHNLKNINTPENYDEIFFGHRTVQIMELPDVANLLRITVKNGKVLDLGCGLGRYFKYFNNCDITGIELSTKAIAAIKEQYPSAHVNQHDLNKGILFADGVFDYVYAGELLEHVEDPQFIINEIYRILKPGGLIIANTPYKSEVPCDEHLWEFELNDIKNLFSKFKVSIFRFCVDYIERWEHFLVIGEK